MKMVYLKSILHRFKGFKVPPNMPKIADLKHNNKWRHHAAICVTSGCVSLTLSFDIFEAIFHHFLLVRGHGGQGILHYWLYSERM